jgi:hypothetical protein
MLHLYLVCQILLITLEAGFLLWSWALKQQSFSRVQFPASGSSLPKQAIGIKSSSPYLDLALVILTLMVFLLNVNPLADSFSQPAFSETVVVE